MIKNILIFMGGGIIGIFSMMAFTSKDHQDELRRLIVSQDAIIENENQVVKKQQLLILKQLDKGNYVKLRSWLREQLTEHVKSGSKNPDDLVKEIDEYLGNNLK